LLPAVKAILTDVRGRRVLVTRRVGPRITSGKDTAENAGVGHLDGFGMRLVVQVDSSDEWQLTWECLYGVQ
jgi:hypothetical protein